MSFHHILIIALIVGFAITSCVNKKNTSTETVAEATETEEKETTGDNVSDTEPEYIRHLNAFLMVLEKETGYEMLFYKDWSPAYKNNTATDSSDEFSYLYLVSPSLWTVFGNSFDDTTQISFVNTRTVSCVLKSKTKSELRPDIKITQISFPSPDDATQAMPQIQRIAKYTLDDRGLKSPNTYWQDGSYVYFARVRAAAFDYRFVQSLYAQFAAGK